MTTGGLRARKKARTRQLIAETAARLFSEHGYENVAVLDVAREADLAEQTVYNYFRTKEALVTDRDEQVAHQLCTLVRARPPGVTAAAAIRDYALRSVASISNIPVEQWKGELGYLATISPTVRRLALEMIDRQADALAVAILDTTEVAPEIARLQGTAISAVFWIIISDSGRRAREGQSQDTIADALYTRIANVVDELDAWFGHRTRGAGTEASPG